MIYSWFKWGESKILKLTHPQHAYLYFKNYRINLLNGFSENIGIEFFLKNLESIYVQDFFKAPRVFHFYYELGLLMQDLAYAVGEDTPLVIDLSYQQFKFGPIPKSKFTHLPLKSIQRPMWSEYRDLFHRVQEQLLMGNCYQLNLTFPYEFETSEFFNDQEILKTFFSLKDLSAYAHATYLGDELILSNSPECLFSYGQQKLYSMPIKGTKKRQGEWKKIWKEMLCDQKEEGELNMITDLLRNDLNKLDLPVAKVLTLPLTS